jgi:hypothetical protein
VIELPLKKMSRAEKLMALEALWKDLSQNEADVESPDWHREELELTEKRVRAGQEKSVDWETAKRQIRNRSK